MAGKEKTYRVEAVIDLPAPLYLGSDFLGLLRPAVIGGVGVHVVLPDFSISGSETVLHPRALVNWVDSFAGRESADDSRWPFGEVFGWGKEREFSATRLLVLPRGRLTLRQARELHRAAEDWVELLGIWLDVVARTDLHEERIKVDKPGQSAYVWVDRDKAPKLFKGKHTITLNLDGLSHEITPWQWGKMLAKASEAARPPEGHLFLRDARHALNMGFHRRAVLDSATATELALAKLRDDALSPDKVGLGDYVRGKAQQIGGLTEFLSGMGRQLPERIQQEVGEPRNKAIHEGREPDGETAARALAKTEEVLDLAFPWNGLLA